MNISMLIEPVSVVDSSDIVKSSTFSVDLPAIKEESDSSTEPEDEIKQENSSKKEEKLEPVTLPPSKAQKLPSLRKPRLPKRLQESSLDLFNEISKENLQNDPILQADISVLHHVFTHSKRLVVIAGAGISVSAGIPDFRSSSNAIFKNSEFGQQLFDASVVFKDAKATHQFQKTVCDLYKVCDSAQPTSFHNLLNDVAKGERLLRMYTQNVDCLDTEMSHLLTKTPLEAPWPQTVQLHGTVRMMNCTKCSWMGEFDPEVFGTDEVFPECPECRELEDVRRVAGKRSQGIGRLRPRIVLYNENNPEAELIGRVCEADLKKRPDGLIVVGTTLKVPGVKRLVKELCQAVHAAKGATVWMNLEEPPQQIFKDFDLVVKGDCQAVPQLLTVYEAEIERQKALMLNNKMKRKASRTLSEGANKTKKRPSKAARAKSEMQVPDLVAQTSSSSSDLSEGESKDTSPPPNSNPLITIAFDSSSDVVSNLDSVQPVKKRKLGVLKNKPTNILSPKPLKSSKPDI